MSVGAVSVRIVRDAAGVPCAAGGRRRVEVRVEVRVDEQQGAECTTTAGHGGPVPAGHAGTEVEVLVVERLIVDVDPQPATSATKIWWWTRPRLNVAGLQDANRRTSQVAWSSAETSSSGAPQAGSRWVEAVHGADRPERDGVVASFAAV